MAGFEKALQKAWERRSDLRGHATAFRLLNGAASGTPGLIVDMFGEYLVVYAYDKDMRSLYGEFEDILAKVDRASMAVSLEVRCPLLDHRVVEYAASLPSNLKLQGARSKLVFKEAVRGLLPESTMTRPKMGFAVPLDEWLRGPLRDWAEDLLDPSRLTEAGYFRPELVRAAWRSHLAGTENLQYPLWNVLMFEAWRRTWQRG